MSLCQICNTEKFVTKRHISAKKLCKLCFINSFEEDIHNFIQKEKLLRPGEIVTIGASGGKDSTVLIHVINLLNMKYNYGVDIHLLSIDEGITGYRDDSLECVKRNSIKYNLPLTIISFKDLFGYTLDEIALMTNRKSCCTFCGVFRRQALDKGTKQLHANKVVTGHNADDIAETVLMNLLRGDISRLSRCTQCVSGELDDLPRIKPFKYIFEKEIVLYAFYNKLDYFSTECLYAPEAYRGYTREYLKNIERINPLSIIDIIKSGDDMRIVEEQGNSKINCTKCGFISSQDICQACTLLDAIKSGQPLIRLNKGNKKKKSS